MDVNIGTSVPLFERMVEESSRATKTQVDTSNEMEDDAGGPGSDALWFPQDFSVGPSSVEIDSLWCLDATWISPTCQYFI